MALTLSEIKDLITFGRAQGLQTMSIEGCAVVYGAPVLELPAAESENHKDEPAQFLPEELRHYSAVGKAAMGRR